MNLLASDPSGELPEGFVVQAELPRAPAPNVMLKRLAIALVIAVAAISAHAQTATDGAGVMTSKDTAVLPVWNNHSGKVEALLLLEPAEHANGTSLFGAGARINTGRGSLQAGLSLDSGSGLALLCNSNSGLATLGALADRCLLASLDSQAQGNRDPFQRPAESVRAEARFERPESLFEVSAGRAEFDTTAIDWLSPTSGLLPGLGILGGRMTQQDISARGKMNIGDYGWVSIGGTLAHARLIPAAGQTGATPGQRWNTTSIGVAVGRGHLSGEVIGRVVDVPGQSATLNSLGVGFSWETPWRGKLSFGAEKSTGNSPLTPATKSPAQQDEGAVPYVRYHQDL